MRQLEDRLLAILILEVSMVIALVLSLIKNLGPGKPVLNHIICTGQYRPMHENEASFGEGYPIYPMVSGIGGLVYIILWIIILAKRHKYQLQDVGSGLSSRNLESLALNLILMSIASATGYSAAQMSRANVVPDNLEENNAWLYPYFNSFIATFLIVNLMAIHCLLKNGRDIFKALFPSLLPSVISKNIELRTF